VAADRHLHGLRVGLTTVKAWSEVYGKRVAAFRGWKHWRRNRLMANRLCGVCGRAARQVFGRFFNGKGRIGARGREM